MRGSVKRLVVTHQPWIFGRSRLPVSQSLNRAPCVRTRLAGYRYPAKLMLNASGRSRIVQPREQLHCILPDSTCNRVPRLQWAGRASAMACICPPCMSKNPQQHVDMGADRSAKDRGPCISGFIVMTSSHECIAAALLVPAGMDPNSLPEGQWRISTISVCAQSKRPAGSRPSISPWRNVENPETRLNERKALHWKAFDRTGASCGRLSCAFIMCIGRSTPFGSLETSAFRKNRISGGNHARPSFSAVPFMAPVIATSFQSRSKARSCPDRSGKQRNGFR